MKLLLTLLVTAVIFTSCGKKDDVKTTDSQKKDSTTQTKTETLTKIDTAERNNSAGGIKNISYEPGKLPASVKYEGKIVAGARWEDKNGQNVLIVCETDEKTSGDNRSKELFAYQYILNGEDAKQLWKVNDFIKDCPVDVMLSLIPKSITVTDINKDGIAENTFLYRMSCKGDVSPDDMKLIMHEGENKYAIRGERILLMDGKKYGGTMNTDPSFNKAPSGFFAYAREQWKKFETEKAGE
ncbi:MAG TPA: hypothetical protein PKE39_05610 [Ignavibacteria bacterium]|nr:hypothetical protein [Ignavibacteria bacterium]HMQ98480.1 hypothetical protein [Ignavibacteria bacterium]